MSDLSSVYLFCVAILKADLLCSH